MPLLNVWSTNGVGRREILVPGRSAYRPFGAVQLINNVGQRQESDWAAIKAAIAAGDVVIQLSRYETDVIAEQLPGNFACGGNVRFDCKKTPQWKLIQGDAFAHFAAIEFMCKYCDADFDSMFKLAGHARREHRQLVEQAEAELKAEAHLAEV